ARATGGIMRGLRRLALRPCAGEASTALAVTSAPVPAVVGTATHGTAGSGVLLPEPMTSRESSGAPPLPHNIAPAFAGASTRPPPNPAPTPGPRPPAAAPPPRAHPAAGARR